MNPPSDNRRLSSLTTHWSVVLAAHAEQPDAVQAAWRQLLERYGGAARRYLAACLREPEAVEELFQEFALSLLNGDFRNFDPARGRFRDYAKAVLMHLVSRHRKRSQKLPRALVSGHPEPVAPDAVEEDLDGSFVASWRDELLARTWATLARAEAEGGPPYAKALRLRANHPDLGSPELAGRLGRELGRPLTPAGVRQLLQRARDRFADVLVEEVAHSLEDPTDERLADEFIALGLYEHCKRALERREGTK